MFSNSESVSFCIFSCSKSHLLVKPYLDRILRMNLVIINTVLIRVYELFKNIFFLFNWGFFYFKSYLALQCFSKLDYKISISKCKETKKKTLFAGRRKYFAMWEMDWIFTVRKIDAFTWFSFKNSFKSGLSFYCLHILHNYTYMFCMAMKAHIYFSSLVFLAYQTCEGCTILPQFI